MTVDQLPELIDCHQLAVGLVRVYKNVLFIPFYRCQRQDSQISGLMTQVEVY